MKNTTTSNVFIDFGFCLFIKPEFYRNKFIENSNNNVYSFRWLFFQINFIYSI